MPKPVKPEKQVVADPAKSDGNSTTSEPAREPIQAETILIIHPGSSTLYFGRATDHFPHSIPHVIARRINNEDKENFINDQMYDREGVYHSDSKEKEAYGLQCAKMFLQTMRISGGYRKPKTSHVEVSEYNRLSKPIEEDQENVQGYTDISNEPEFLIGNDALNIDPAEGYVCRYPIAYGQLNTHAKLGGSITAISEDIETLWANAILKHLNIPKKDFNFYRVVLLIPDIFDKNDVKMLTSILLERLRFSSIIVCQESVCGAFGSGIMSACIVDVGAQKTSICCVEDGMSLPNTRLTFKYGGNDISRTFLSLMRMSEFPYRKMNINNRQDAALLRELKETFCHLSLDIPSGKIHEFQVMSFSQPSLFVYKLKLGDEPILAPTGLFVPDLFGIVGERLVEVYSSTQEYDKEDLLDDRYLLEKKDVDPKKAKLDNPDSETSQQDSTSQDATTTNNPTKEHGKLDSILHDGMPLDEAILYSIEQCNNQETKRKMYSTVLLIGGGWSFKGADEFLTRRLQGKLPPHYQYMKDQVEVISRPKEGDPRTTAWKGGAVLSILDSSQELWVSRKEWKQYGVRILRERCSFQWSSNIDKL